MACVAFVGIVAGVSYRFYTQKKLRGRTGFRSWVSKGGNKPDPSYMNECYNSVGSERAHVIEEGSFAN